MSIASLRAGLLVLGAVALALGSGSCGKAVGGGQEAFFDSNTNWLSRCVDDGECSGSLRCYCGMCTKPCGQDQECNLLEGAACAQSSESVCGEQASAGGLCVLECRQDADCGPGFHCRTGQCVPAPCEPAPQNLLSWDDVFQIVSADLAATDSDDRPFQRFVTLGNVSEGSASCGGLPADARRQALAKLLNSLSIEAALTAPVAIDADQRVYRIDLRDYGWDRPLTENGFYNDAWEALVANDLYAMAFIGDDADDIIADTGTTTPILLFDSFVATATDPSVYYTLLDLPDSLDGYLVDEFGVQGTPPIQAGFVEQQEFIAGYWPMEVRAGYVWTISDFGRGSGALFADPSLAPLGQTELVFTLPNGLSAFAFLAADGRRLAGWTVAQDAQERDGVVKAPRSSWRRHPRTVAVRDEVRDYALANPTRYSDFALSLINQRFPGQQELSLLLERNYDGFVRRALERLGIDPQAPDPILRSFSEFDRDVTLETAAAELLLSPDDLRDNLLLLSPALAPLDGGSIERRVFTLYYRSALCTLSVVNNNQPAVCP